MHLIKYIYIYIQCCASLFFTLISTIVAYYQKRLNAANVSLLRVVGPEQRKLLSHNDVYSISAPPDGVTCMVPGGRTYVQHTPFLLDRPAWRLPSQWSDCHSITVLHVNERCPRLLTEPRGAPSKSPVVPGVVATSALRVLYRASQTLASDEQGPASSGCPTKVTDSVHRLITARHRNLPVNSLTPV